MVDKLALITVVLGLVAIAPLTEAQQPAPSFAEPVECSWARIYAARGRVAESQYWQGVCSTKSAAMSRRAAPEPRRGAPGPAPPVSTASGRPPVCESNGTNAAPAASVGRTPEAGQIRLGMTRDEVVAACCWRPYLRIQEHYVATDKNGEEQSVAPGNAGQDLLEEPYLSAITCGSGAGLTDVGFSPPPAESRVSSVIHAAFATSINSSSEDYLAGLVSRYGEPDAQLGPDTLDASQRSSARTYKWLFRRDGRDRDCGPPLHERDQSFFGVAPPDRRPCATQLTVRIASDPRQVIEARFKLFNPHELDEARDRHVAALNRRHGTHFEDAKTLYARAKEKAREAAVVEAQQRDAEREAERRESLTPMQRAEEDNDRDAKRVFDGIMGLGFAARAADEALGTTGKGSPARRAAPPPGQRPLGEQWAAEKEERRRNCLQRCEQEAQRIYRSYDENADSFSERRNLQLNTCNGSCP